METIPNPIAQFALFLLLLVLQANLLMADGPSNENQDSTSTDGQSLQGSGDAHQARGRLPRFARRLGRPLGTVASEPRSVAARPAAQEETEAESLLGRGISCLKSRKYDEAIDWSTGAIEKNSALPGAYRCRGMALHGKGALEKARADLNLAAELAPNDPMIAYSRGHLLFSLGEYNPAIRDVNFAIENAPGFADAYRVRGQCWLKVGDTRKALKDCNKAIQLDPKLPEAYSSRGDIYLLRGDYDQAIRDFTRAIELDSSGGGPLQSRALAQLMRGAMNECINDCTEVIRLAPEQDLAQAYEVRGLAYLLIHDFDAAITDSTRAIQLCHGKRPDSLENRALAWMSKGRYSNAITDLKATLAISPEDDSAAAKLAYLLAACPEAVYRDGSQAVLLATQVCERQHWKDISALKVLSAAYAETSNFKRAVEVAEKALAGSQAIPGAIDLRKDLEQMLSLYRQGVPFRVNKTCWFDEHGDKIVNAKYMDIPINAK